MLLKHSLYAIFKDEKLSCQHLLAISLDQLLRENWARNTFYSLILKVANKQFLCKSRPDGGLVPTVGKFKSKKPGCSRTCYSHTFVDGNRLVIVCCLNCGLYLVIPGIYKVEIALISQLILIVMPTHSILDTP